MNGDNHMTTKAHPIAAGDSAPDFTLSDQNGENVTLSDYRGKNVILFFYPAAMTPGCTKEACDFRDSIESLQARSYEVIGISKDSVDKQRKFAERDALEYPLVSDESLDVHRAYGAYGEKNLYGKKVEGVIRSTFVINSEGIIEHALRNVKATGHVSRIRKLLGLDG